MELTTALLPVVLSPRGAGAQQSNSSTFAIMIDDLHSGIDPLFLENVFSEFFRRNIPVCCVADLALLKARDTDHLVAPINAALQREVGLFEIILAITDLGDERRYFQMRSADSLRAAASEIFSPGRGPAISCVVDRREEDRLDFSSYGTAGFRVLIRPQHAAESGAEFVGRGQLRLLGGKTLRVVEPVLDALDDSLRSGADSVVTLSLAGVIPDGASEALTQVAAIADMIATRMATGSVFVTRPSDFLLHFGPRRPAELALVVGAGDTEDERANVRALVEALAEHAIPVTVVAPERPEWLPPTGAFCPIWPGIAPESRDVGTLPDCLFLQDPSAEADLPPVPIVLVSAGNSWNGLRADGRLQMVLSDWAGISQSLGPTHVGQAVFFATADIASPRQRAAISRQLALAKQDGDVHLYTVANLAKVILPPEPVLTRLWSTHRRRVTDPARARVVSEGERELLRDDAKLAWRFIERFTDPDTGLCAGTVQEGSAGRINREVTLWDVASQIQGIIAAAALEIISDDDGKDRLQRIVTNIPARNLSGARLPPAMFLADSSQAVVIPGFDICDTGRFLIALRAATSAGFVTADVADATLNAWDLATAVQDRQPFNHDGKTWQNAAQTHCTPYFDRAFADLGLHMTSPYEGGGTTADDLIRLLYSAAFIGSYGTEPLLLEAIELGASPQSAFLADVLFDAQLSWFETTGQLKCVSEAPLNREPWFLFQGLRVDRLGADAWTIESLDKSEAFRTEAFLRDAELLSAKSAYLWAATHPHPYSDRVLKLIRDKARIDNFGFSVGVFTRTLQPMKNYGDLNTNGIILTAIASILAGQ